MTTHNYSRDQITTDRASFKGSPVGDALFFCGQLQTVTKAQKLSTFMDWHTQTTTWQILEATTED